MIAIGSDHGGYALKKALMAHLDKRGLEYKDFGTYSEASCDYPVFAKAVAHAVASSVFPSRLTRFPASEPLSAATASAPRSLVSTMTRTFSAWAHAWWEKALPSRSPISSSTRPFPTMSGTSAASPR